MSSTLVTFLELLKEKTNAKLIAYVGDTVDDVSASLSAQCVAISLIDDCRADYSLHHITEIKKLVLR